MGFTANDGSPLTAREVAGLVPMFARRVLYVGEEPKLFKQEFRIPDVTVYTASPTALPRLRYPRGRFHCLFLNGGWSPQKDLEGILSRLAPLIESNGMIFMALCLTNPADADLFRKQVTPTVEEAGLILYDRLPREDWPLREDACVFICVRQDYNPLLHAESLSEQGRPDWSIDVLRRISFEHLPKTREGLGGLYSEIHRYYLVWSDCIPEPQTLELIARARKQFFLAAHVMPRQHEAYRNQAELWHRRGQDAMAARLLRSVLHAGPDERTRGQLASLHPKPDPVHPEHQTVPEWEPGEHNPRVLVITHDWEDYGMDTLFDGLCNVLGQENVLEFPWKASLHQTDAAEAEYFPCVFSHPGKEKSAEDIVQELGEGRFSFMLFADIVQQTHQEVIRSFLAAAPDLPVVVYDTWDDFHSQERKVLGYLGRDSVDAYFKREMLSIEDYGRGVYPLPFAYSDRLIPSEITRECSRDLFWAGNPLFGTRQLYLDYLAERFGMRFDASYTHAEYVEVLGQSRMGLSLFGYAYDTARYWELPAHGCMMLAERPPLRIPYDFEEGKSAVFFDDLPELEEKLAYYLKHPHEASEIARAGHLHFKRYHTSSVRAKQLMGRLRELGIVGT